MRSLVFVLAILGASPALADPCDDLWFSRNLIMDRAGYCFGTALGRAVFDNAGCAGKSVSIGRDAQDFVDTLREQERTLRCKVDTGRRRLDLDDLAFRWRLDDLPVADQLESGCIGWQEAATTLWSGRGPDARAIGRIEPGDNLLYRHLSVDGWDYVTVHGPQMGPVKSAGWLRFDTKPTSCRGWAG